MSTVRPAGWPSVPAKPTSTQASGAGAATRSAFFQAALGDAAPTRPAQAAVSVQMQAQAQAQPQRQAPARPFTQPDAQPQKILRPGSLLNIVIWSDVISAIVAAYLLVVTQAKPELRDKVSFGPTRHLPLSPPGTPASDYVPGGPKAVIAAVVQCGGRRATYKTYTDGAAGVLFTRTRSEPSTRACLAKAVPQATYETERSW